MAKRGRKPIKIDQDIFENLCGLQCTLTEIAFALNCSEDTIENWCKKTYKKKFSEVFRQKRAKGFISLRKAQFQLAMTNPAMAIFLGKNYLQQTDKQEVTLTEINQDVVKEIENKILDK